MREKKILHLLLEMAEVKVKVESEPREDRIGDLWWRGMGNVEKVEGWEGMGRGMKVRGE